MAKFIMTVPVFMVAMISACYGESFSTAISTSSSSAYLDTTVSDILEVSQQKRRLRPTITSPIDATMSSTMILPRQTSCYSDGLGLPCPPAPSPWTTGELYCGPQSDIEDFSQSEVIAAVPQGCQSGHFTVFGAKWDNMDPWVDIPLGTTGDKMLMAAYYQGDGDFTWPADDCISAYTGVIDSCQQGSLCRGGHVILTSGASTLTLVILPGYAMPAERAILNFTKPHVNIIEMSGSGSSDSHVQARQIAPESCATLTSGDQVCCDPSPTATADPTLVAEGYRQFCSRYWERTAYPGGQVQHTFYEGPQRVPITYTLDYFGATGSISVNYLCGDGITDTMVTKCKQGSASIASTLITDDYYFDVTIGGPASVSRSADRLEDTHLARHRKRHEHCSIQQNGNQICCDADSTLTADANDVMMGLNAFCNMNNRSILWDSSEMICNWTSTANETITYTLDYSGAVGSLSINEVCAEELAYAVVDCNKGNISFAGVLISDYYSFDITIGEPAPI